MVSQTANQEALVGMIPLLFVKNIREGSLRISEFILTGYFYVHEAFSSFVKCLCYACVQWMILSGWYLYHASIRYKYSFGSPINLSDTSEDIQVL